LKGKGKPEDVVRPADKPITVITREEGSGTRGAFEELALHQRFGAFEPTRTWQIGMHHHPDHIREAAAEAGLAVAHLSQAFLRMEYGSEVTGNYGALVKQKPQ
jgi:ABC-type phosphate transport system substrate-binding protein